MASHPKPTIPNRTSSKTAMTSPQLKLQVSRAEIKRKLSTVSFEDAPVEHTRLKIEDLKTQRSEQHLHRSWLDGENEARIITSDTYKNAVRETNKRITSLGDQLWKENRKLRKLKEARGAVPELGPDTKGAFIPVLLSLYIDPWNGGKRSEYELKADAISLYEADKDAPEGKLWCAISGDYFDEDHVKAGHIVPYRLGPEAVDYVFGQGSGSRLHSADNCILMHTSVEKQFANGSFVLLPADTDEKPIKRWKIQMTNKAAVNADMGRLWLKDLDGKEVQFKNANRPAARFLYYHFVVMLLRNKRDRNSGWEHYITELPTAKPFATMGPYLRKSMLRVLAKVAGDIDEEAEKAVMTPGEDGMDLFDEDKKLESGEEEEIARRIFEVHDAKAEEDDEEDEEDEDPEQ